MKKKVLLSMVLATFLTGTFITSCSSSDNEDPIEKPVVPGEKEPTWSTDGGLKACDNILFDNNVIGNGDQEFVFKGKQTLKKGTYLLKGWVYIADGSELTIEPGTIIKGDKQTKAALIVERGGKLFAKGTADSPIVFTSEEAKGERRPGDWGGIILCGKANNNQKEMQIEGGPRTKHGGSVDDDNSGILSYVRIEFAGYPFAKDQEINGLTFGSVGSKTQIDHIQVSYTNDDSYEWFGGKVNCKYLIAYKGWDDDFDTDNGFSGKVQYCLSVRDPKIADASLSNGFESDNCAGGDDVQPYTTATFSNVTFIGPMGGKTKDFQNTTDYITGGAMFPNNGSGTGKYQSAMQIRRGSHLSCYNILAVGYPVGMMIDGEKGNTRKDADNLKLQYIWFANVTDLGCDKNGLFQNKYFDWTTKAVDETKAESFSATFFKAQKGNAQKNVSDLNLTGESTNVGANYMPLAGSPLLTNGVKVDGMEDAQYIGAFKANDTWMNGWTNFDPENTDY